MLNKSWESSGQMQSRCYAFSFYCSFKNECEKIHGNLPQKTVTVRASLNYTRRERLPQAPTLVVGVRYTIDYVNNEDDFMLNCKNMCIYSFKFYFKINKKQYLKGNLKYEMEEWSVCFSWRAFTNHTFRVICKVNTTYMCFKIPILPPPVNDLAIRCSQYFEFSSSPLLFSTGVVGRKWPTLLSQFPPRIRRVFLKFTNLSSTKKNKQWIWV